MEASKLEIGDQNVSGGKEIIKPLDKLVWGALPTINMMVGNDPIARDLLENNPPEGFEGFPPGLIVCGAGCLWGIVFLGPRIISSIIDGVSSIGSKSKGKLTTLDVVTHKGKEKQVVAHGAGTHVLKDTETGEVTRVEGGRFKPARKTSEPKGRQVHRRDEGVRNVGKITRKSWWRK